MTLSAGITPPIRGAAQQLRIASALDRGFRADAAVRPNRSRRHRALRGAPGISTRFTMARSTQWRPTSQAEFLYRNAARRIAHPLRGGVAGRANYQARRSKARRPDMARRLTYAQGLVRDMREHGCSSEVVVDLTCQWQTGSTAVAAEASFVPLATA